MKTKNNTAKPAAKKTAATKAAKPAAKKAAKPDATRKGKEANVTDKQAAAAHKPAAKKAAKPAPVAKKQTTKLIDEVTSPVGAPVVTKKTAIRVAPAPVPTVETAVEILRKSSVKHPVQATWDMFDNLRQAALDKGETLRRKDAIAHAVSAGIAFYTARTQYQSWKTANKF